MEFLWTRKTRFEETTENNAQEWRKFPLQVRKHLKNGRFLQKK